jgi:hypothetical protein
MFSNDVCKVGTSIVLQVSVITCINSGIVPGLFFFQIWKNEIIKASCWYGKCRESPETSVEISQKLEVSNKTIRRSQVFLHL